MTLVRQLPTAGSGSPHRAEAEMRLDCLVFRPFAMPQRFLHCPPPWHGPCGPGV